MQTTSAELEEYFAGEIVKFNLHTGQKQEL
jgi:hypothetical protein